MAYVDHIRSSQTNAEKILLLSKESLVPFYTKCGFTCVGASDVHHGWSMITANLHMNSVIVRTAAYCSF